MSPLEESEISPINNAQILCIKIKRHIKNNGFKIRIENFLITELIKSNVFNATTKLS